MLFQNQIRILRGLNQTFWGIAKWREISLYWVFWFAEKSNEPSFQSVKYGNNV